MLLPSKICFKTSHLNFPRETNEAQEVISVGEVAERYLHSHAESLHETHIIETS